MRNLINKEWKGKKMGMYLNLHRIKDSEPDRQHPNTEVVSEDIFPQGKFVGDLAFASADFENDYIGCETSYCCVIMYWRPKNFDKARKWLKQTRKIPKGNKERLLNALNLAEKDKELYFEFS